MPKTQTYTTGWIDSSIHTFLADIRVPPPSMTYALITCLDSCFDLPSIVNKSQAFSDIQSHGRMIGKGLVITTRKLLAMEQKHRIFYGFDEVWFFPHFHIQPKPPQICITGPMDLSEELPDKLVRWMEDSQCALGLGDGTGLNFVVKLTGIAKHLVQHWSASVDNSGTA
ncbi:hypothetical protein HYR99_05030 [Candidatus Poribacteria bacterium]|nr:hypothetical protein [Candidatus Poribacteria bacterium]